MKTLVGMTRLAITRVSSPQRHLPVGGERLTPSSCSLALLSCGPPMYSRQ